MDWARAKSIILILLAALNIFLLAKVVIDSGGQGISRETILNMEKILDRRGVRLECTIPRYDKDTPRLIFGSGKANQAAYAKKLLGESYTAEKSDGQENTYISGTRTLTFTSGNSFTYIDKKPDQKVDIIHISETEKYVRKFLKDKNIDNSSYVLDAEPVKQGSEVVFNFTEKYKDFLVFDNYLKAVVSENGVTRLEVRHKEIKGFSADKVRDISAAYQILLEHFNGDENTVITDVDIGYRDDTVNLEQEGLQSSEQLPVWRIKVKGTAEPIRYFGASDGKEIK